MARVTKKDAATRDERLALALVPQDEQPYMLPENWEWTHIHDVCSTITDGTHQTPNYSDDGYMFLSSKNVTSGRIDWDNVKYIPKELHQVLYNRLAPQLNDILLAKNGTTGVAAIVERCCIFDIYVSLALLRPKQKIIKPNFLLYLLNSIVVRTQFDKELTGIGVQNLHLRDIKSTAIPLPPFAEQQRIVDRIESLFAKLDAAKELAQSAFDTFETRKAAILHKAFTGELTTKWREEHDVGLGSWEEKTLFSCGSWYGGGTPNTAHNAYWENGTIMWVTPKDMKTKIIEDTMDHITECAIADSTAVLIIEPAILFVMRSGILRRTLPISMTKQPVTINQDMKALVPNKINQEYLYWVSTWKGNDIRERCSKSGTTVESINTKALYNFCVPVPSEPEQEEIVRIIDSMFEKEQKAKELCDVIDKIDLMKKAILARAFRGGLGTNDPTEESALELLKQCLKG